ncbi:MAG: hypothetical protein ACYC6N_15345 [Pirellulaceae bacterium]
MKYYLSNAACDTPLGNVETFFYDWISGEDTALRLPNSIQKFVKHPPRSVRLRLRHRKSLRVGRPQFGGGRAPAQVTARFVEESQYRRDSWWPINYELRH